MAPSINEPIQELIKNDSQISLNLIEGDYLSSLMDGMDLVIAATDDQALNEAVSHDAAERHIFVNVVDNPSLCTFIMPAIIDRSPVTIAIGTGGTAPVLARLLRGKIEALIPHRFGALAGLAAKYRERVKVALPKGPTRKAFGKKFLKVRLLSRFLVGIKPKLNSSLKRVLIRVARHNKVRSI